MYFRSFSYPYFELNFLRNEIYVGIDDLWTLKALVWTTNPTGSRTPSTRGVPSRRGYPRLAFSIGNVYFRSFSYPYFELNFLRNQIYVGIDDLWTLKALVWTTNPTGSRTPSTRGGTQPKRVLAPCLFYRKCYFRSFSYPYFELNFLRNQIYVGIDDLWTLKALVWTTNPTGSRTPSTRGGTQPKRVPAPCLFYRKCYFRSFS